MCYNKQSIHTYIIMSASVLLSPLARRAGGASPWTWTCRACVQSQRGGVAQQRNTFATRTGEAAHKSGKGRRRLLVVGGGIAVGAGVVALNEDAKHAWAAAQRTYRVAATLALNIKEYELDRANNHGHGND